MIRKVMVFFVGVAVNLVAGIHESVSVGFYQQVYNNLPEVEASNRIRLADPGFKQNLLKLEEIIRKYGLNDVIGVRLLHKHFNVEIGVMSERLGKFDRVLSLVTEERILNEEILPASWIFNESGVVPFEYSIIDYELLQARAKIHNAGSFFEEIGEKILELGYRDLLALAIIEKNKLIAQKNETYLERSYVDLKTSVVQTTNKENLIANGIQTSWSFGTPKEVECTTYCMPDWNRDKSHHEYHGKK